MSLRTFFGASIGLATAFAIATPLTVYAQPSGKVARVATLWTTSRAVAQPYLDAIQDGLRDLGWDAGRNVIFEDRFTDGKPDSLPVLAAEIVALKADVVVAPLNPAALALKRLTTTMPIIFVVAIDPVGTGLAASLGHPGSNATGITVAGPETAAKRLQMLRELAPTARRVGVVGSAAFPGFGEIHNALITAAPGLGFTIVNSTASDADGFARALESISAQRIDALFALGDNLTHLHLREIVTLATRTRIPSMYSQQEFCDGGGLACYGVDLQSNYRRSAIYIDKILRGVPPAAIPIEIPRTFNLVLNLRTAKALGINVPPSLKIRADRLIE